MAKAKAASADAKLNAQAERLTDLAAEVADLRGHLARRDAEVEKLRARCLTVAAGHVICRRCLRDGERSVVEDNLRRMLEEQQAEIAQLRQLLAAGGMEQTA
jgi:predicted RNase H-like nuclease (RuvC/YqgF family)